MCGEFSFNIFQIIFKGLAAKRGNQETDLFRFTFGS
jgi:hypothetical protein